MTRLLVALGIALSIGSGSAAAQSCARSVASLPVCAGEPDEAALAEARARFEEGLAHVEARRWADALGPFSASYTASCVPTALLNMATSYRALGRWVEARAAVTALLERHDDLPDALRTLGTEILSEARAQIAVLSLTELPTTPRPTVRLDGQRCEDSDARPLDLDVDPGRHALDVSAAGRLPFHWEGPLEAAARQTIPIELPAVSDDSALIWGISLGIAGAVLIGVGIALGVYFAGQGPPFDDRVDGF